MPCPNAVFAARDGDVDREVLDLDHAKGGTDRDDLKSGRQRGLDLGNAQVEDLDVEVLGLCAQQGIADAPAHEERTAPGCTQQAHHLIDRAELSRKLQ